ncbi:hypothetical protein JHK84_047361 [Glycine max]|nr:hypothetical protein JHK84_047361 [Glycine max]
MRKKKKRALKEDIVWNFSVFPQNKKRKANWSQVLSSFFCFSVILHYQGN